VSDIPSRLIWPWQVCRYYRTEMRDIAVRHARERAAFDAWVIECEYAIYKLLQTPQTDKTSNQTNALPWDD
jgi:hypothetical protein